MSTDFTARLGLKEVSSPSPGDGICPANSQFDDVSRASFSLWNLLSLNAERDSEPILIADKLLKILQQIPGLVAHPSKGFTIREIGDCFLQYALEWVTTTDQNCEQRIKRTIHHQLLALSEPTTLELGEATGAWSPWPGTQRDWEHFSFLVLAWTFIISSRWVETFSMAGEETYMKFSKDASLENFRELVAKQQWEATIIRGGKILYAPWSLRRRDLPQSSYCVHVSPDSSYAFQLLVRFCTWEKIGQECVAAALAVVLMLPQSTVQIKIPSLNTAPVNITNSKDHREGILYKYFGSYRDEYYDKIFKCLNQCITMSCTLKGISSLLCGVFFDPAIPCNLIGAHLSGIIEAIGSVQGDAEAIVRLMAKKSPSTSPFWLAAVWTGQSEEILSSALAGMPPLSFPMAAWTESQQSFLQVGYQAITDRADFITRAREFQTIYFVTPSAPTPFTPSPPFGETAVSGTSLEIRSHLAHKHSPIQHKTYWVLDSEDLGSAGFKDISHPVVCLPPIPRGSHSGSPRLNRSSQVIDTADRISSDATLNLFIWYRELEGGLLLEEFSGRHPWVICDSDESCSSHDGESTIDDNSCKRMSEKRIEDWRDEVLIERSLTENS